MSEKPKKYRTPDPHDPRSWSRRSPRGGNPIWQGIELEPSTLWLRERWEEEREAGLTDLGFTKWAAQYGVVVNANAGWDDFRPGRSTLVPLSSVERPLDDGTSPGAMREVEMRPIVSGTPGRRRPLRKRHRRRRPQTAD